LIKENKAKQLTFWAHADSKALLQPTVLTAVAIMLCDWAFLVASTRVAQLFPDAPFEKPFTPFTADYTVVPTW